MERLGSNTCVQEAYNLAWKIAYVEKGIAGRGLLDSYNQERREVGALLVKESNDGMRRHAAIWAARRHTHTHWACSQDRQKQEHKR